MKVLVLGGSGMLGHQVCRRLSERFEVWASYRGDTRPWSDFGNVDPDRALGGVDASVFSTVEEALGRIRPNAVINCIGIVKQREEAKAAAASILVNSLFPHQLADQCARMGARLVHVSTDCVFSGRVGGYTEQDIPDPVDLYGRSKLLGEVDRPGCLTIRTSIVGWEVAGRLGLLEWFASNRGHTIKGYPRAVFTGLCSAFLADLIGFLSDEHPGLSGVYQVATEPTNKFSLLVGLRDALGWHDMVIERDEDFECDRSLVGARFASETGWQAPSWGEMIAELATEWPTYEEWRRLR
jgi:dTDP-4-dehydrorhamnose reductase